MGSADPFERNWLEVRILNRLNDRKHPINLRELRDNLVANKEDTIVCTIFNLRDEGLVKIRETSILNDKLVEITPLGKAILLDILSGNRCD